MPRDYKVYLDDILQSVERIRDFTRGLTRDTFVKDLKTCDAVIRNLEVIGEAIKNIPDSVRNKYPDVEWKKIAGLRDILIHEYFGIDVDIVWDIVKNKLPNLEGQVRRILTDES